MTPAPRSAEGRARTIFFGSGTFGATILDALRDVEPVDLVAVVAAPDRPAGRSGGPRPVPVARLAREHGLALLQPPRVRSPESIEAIAALRPDLGVLADFGQIIPRSLLDLPPSGILNVHPSLLPRHRGATPVAATILSGDRAAGVTIIRMDEGLDTGPVVAAASWPLTGTETAQDLERVAASVGADLLGATIPRWLTGEIEPSPQGEAGATRTRPLRREDGRIDPTMRAEDLERRVRAFVPWPGSFVDTPLGRLIVWRAVAAPAAVRSEDVQATEPPGTVVEDGDGFALVVGDGRLRILEGQLAGRRRMSAAELRRGTPGLVGASVVASPAAAGR